MSTGNVEQVLFDTPVANSNGAPTPGTSTRVARADHNHGTLAGLAPAVVVSGTITASATGNGTAVTVSPDSGFSKFIHVNSVTVGWTGASSSASSTVTITATFTDATTASCSLQEFQPASGGASSTIFGVGTAIRGASSLKAATSLGWSTGLDGFLVSGKAISSFSCVASSSVEQNAFGAFVKVSGSQA